MHGTTIGVIEGNTRSLDCSSHGGVPKLQGLFFEGEGGGGVPIIMIKAFWDLQLGSPYLGKLPYLHQL